MTNRYLLLFVWLQMAFVSVAQITTDPSLPVADKAVTVIFNSAEESRLGFYTGDLYAHTGVIVEGKSGWEHVIGSWGVNSTQPRLTHQGGGIYHLVISPDILTYYSVSVGEKVQKLAFVFRASDNSRQTNDLFVNVYASGLVVEITAPSSFVIWPRNQLQTLSAQTSVDASLKLLLDGNTLAETTGRSISATHLFTESGTYRLVAEATANGLTKTDTVEIFIREEVIVASKPAGSRKGINYPADTSALLVLFAPGKESVFVLGEFNEWKPENAFQMKRDGDHFWLELTGLEKGREYPFQYLVDGTIKIADPYAEKVLDPWNDSYIDEVTYPGLIAYPAGKTEGVVSVLQPGQETYDWAIDTFTVPEKGRLIVYELLIRDFTQEHTFRAVREKLSYLKDLNINVLELMPVNEFEGNSSWGYNPSFYFAPDKYYGPGNELKRLIDACHQQGIAVVIDMVLNHSYGQSPLAQMYMDNGTIAADNPWYNRESNFQNSSLRWGYDFNHESAFTKELIDSVNRFWMSEYKVDGFRFDFTKGFSNTPYGESDWGSAYDVSRIANLKRMADAIWAYKTDALVIFEHLADNAEEKELADYGIMLWGNMHSNYREAGKGNTGSSGLGWGIYKSRGWQKPHLVSYAESHDEERIMVDLLALGYSSGDYNIRQLPVALDRIALNAVFHLPLPGPKMIWQFGERGYDVSINAFGGRLAEKPSRWEYLEEEGRTGLFGVMAQLNHLKQTYEVFSSENFNHNLNGQMKWYYLSSTGHHVFAIGNFGTTPATATVNLPVPGKWFRFFVNDSLETETIANSFTLEAGEYRLYSTQKMKADEVVTWTPDVEKPSGRVILFPNPANDRVTLLSDKPVSQVSIHSLTGALLCQTEVSVDTRVELSVGHLLPGIYLVHLIRDGVPSVLKLTIE